MDEIGESDSPLARTQDDAPVGLQRGRGRRQRWIWLASSPPDSYSGRQAVTMTATAWSDYVCPWAYLGRDRTALMRGLGVEVTVLPYELHPEIPPDGVAVRPGGRLDRVFGTVGAECAELGIPFRAPTRSPNTHHALEVSEVVRVHAPDVWPRFDEAIARTHWVDGGDIGDRSVLRRLLADVGGPVDDVADLVADGAGSSALAASMAQARSVGVMATPAWWVDDALLIPGAQPRETIERWITKMLAARAREVADGAGSP